MNYICKPNSPECHLACTPWTLTRMKQLQKTSRTHLAKMSKDKQTLATLWQFAKNIYQAANTTNQNKPNDRLCASSHRIKWPFVYNISKQFCIQEQQQNITFGDKCSLSVLAKLNTKHQTNCKINEREKCRFILLWCKQAAKLNSKVFKVNQWSCIERAEMDSFFDENQCGEVSIGSGMTRMVSEHWSHIFTILMSES